MIEPVALGNWAVRRIAIIDDQREYAEGTSLVVEDAQLEPVMFLDGYTNIADLISDVAGRADAVLCDHRLRPGSYAPFDGAQAVAELYSAGVPAVLLTMYEKIDADV